jgi:outer membrane lipoprotein LolB
MRRCLRILPVLLMVSGCSLFQSQPQQPYQMAEQQPLSKLEHWSLEGRLAYQDNKESLSAFVTWLHDKDQDRIVLSGPLSQGKVAITVTAHSVVVEDGSERREYPGAVDSVVKEQLGLSMPVNALRYWILGLSEPGVGYLDVPDGILQQGWMVRYREMQEWSAQQPVPRKITVEQDKIKIKFVVDRWDLS